VVKPAETEAVPKAVSSHVEAWVDGRERGCRPVSSIDEADVLLEFNQYKPNGHEGRHPGRPRSGGS
jgi:hypothetical protein